MTLRIALSTLFSLCLVLAACGADEPVAPSRPAASTIVSEALQGQVDQAVIDRGAGLYKTKKCFGCHLIKGGKPLIGPNLEGVGQRMTVAELEGWLRHPKQMKPRTLMPAFDGGDDELIAMIAWLRTL